MQTWPCHAWFTVSLSNASHTRLHSAVPHTRLVSPHSHFGRWHGEDLVSPHSHLWSAWGGPGQSTLTLVVSMGRT